MVVFDIFDANKCCTAERDVLCYTAFVLSKIPDVQTQPALSANLEVHKHKIHYTL
jgi:hypothetical protein